MVLAQAGEVSLIDHQLVDGDALVFQLIDSTTFKVRELKANDTL